MIVNPYINPYDIAYQLYQNLNLPSGLIRIAIHLVEFYIVHQQRYSRD
jgi:hypothetical protein